MALTQTYEQPTENKDIDDFESIYDPREFVASVMRDGVKKRKVVFYTPSIVQFTSYRAAGHFKRIRRSPLDGLYRVIRKKLFMERLFQTGELDKIFCSQFLNNKQVIFGTKCNRLMVLHTQNGSLFEVENLKSAPNSYTVDSKSRCGIHAIAINPSGTRLVTGAENPNDTAVFDLPSLAPYSIGDVGHRNWIFDIRWLDDRHYVSGAKDSKIIVWDTETQRPDLNKSRRVYGPRNELPEHYRHTAPKLEMDLEPNMIESDLTKGVRAIVYHPNHKEFTTMTMNATLCRWDTRTFEGIVTPKQIHGTESVCLATEQKLTAVGSKSVVTFVDDILNVQRKVPVSNHTGVRSLSFSDNILTVGTGNSEVSFIDIRSFRCIEAENQSTTSLNNNDNDEHRESSCSLVCSPTRLAQMYGNSLEDLSTAIFTHCYDPSGLRLFAAGGPLSATSKGCYASLWQ